MTTNRLQLPSLPGLNSLPDLGDFDAFHLFQRESERERSKLQLSRTTFFKDAIRIRGSVLYRVWPSVLGITLYATLIAAADIIYGFEWKTSNSIISPLSVVLGLLIVFRNGSSYDRWYEGRKDFTNAMTDVRSLSRFIWINVDCEAGEKMITPKNSPKRINDVEVNALRQQRLSGKRRAIRMLACFLYATKHHLREEKGIEWEDYQGLIPEDVRSSFYRLSKQSREFYRRSMHSVLSSSAPATGTSEAFTGSATGAPPVASREQPDERTPLTAEEAEEDAAHANLPAVPFPLFCLHFVASYLTSARRAGLLTNDAGPAGFSMANTLINSLTAQLFNMERITQTPIPVIYGVHLKQTVLLYLLALPLTLVSELSWRMVPVVTIVAFTLIGLEGISSEVEMPFGHDPSDHNLDLLCATVRHELEHMMLLLDEGVQEEA